MYQKLPNLVFGFHGCDYETYLQVLNNDLCMKKSQNAYDWLGHGIYFWENNYQRALEWAEKSSKIKTPAVIGAVILELKDFSTIRFSSQDMIACTVATVVAAVVGYLSICFMMRLVRGKKYKYFAVYCAVIGFIAVGYYFM